MRNYWKAAFFTLLIVAVILPAAVIGWLAATPSAHYKEISTKQEALQGTKLLSIHTGKEQVEDMINKELRQKAPNLDIYANLNKDIAIKGKMQFFNQEFPYIAQFDPQVLGNGDMLLKARDVQVGLISLPGSKVLSLMQATVPLPDYVSIYPADNLIRVDLTKMKINSNYKVKAEKFDLNKNDIEFGVYKK